VSYGVPALAAVVLLFLFSFAWTQLRPLNWARSNLVRGVTLVEDLGASLEPEMVIVMTPIVMTPIAEPTAVSVEPFAVALADQPAAAADAAVPAEPAAVALVAPEGAPAEAAAAEAAAANLPAPTVESLVGVGGPSPEHTTAAPEVAAVATDTPAPTDTPVALPTATTVPMAAGDAARTGGIGGSTPTAARTATATWTPLSTPEAAPLLVVGQTPTPAVAGDVARAAALPEGGIAQAAGLGQPAGESTPTPLWSPTPTPVPLPTIVPTSTPVVYQVRAGDTLVSIAVRYEVTVDALMAANNISERDVYVIQPGQMLIIPQPTPAPVAAAVEVPPANYRLEAPALLEPADGATVECELPGVLSWQRVQFIKDSDKYLLHVGFVSGPPNGDQETITWVLAQMRPVTETSWEMDPSLCDLAPVEYDRQWRWWVEVTEDEGGAPLPVSPPSGIRSFRWE
jgi:LysM repeat protein